MEKKLLSALFILTLFFLNPLEGFGQQCPTSVGVTANPGTEICAGEEITFTANPTGGNNYTYQWQVNQTNVSGETASTFKSSSLTTGQKVRVIVKSTTVGSETCYTNSSEVTITVNPIRTVTATIAANNANICPGASVNFTISSQTNIGSGSSYEWRVNGTSQGNGNTFTSNTLSAGDKVQLWVDSSVPCTAPILSNEIIITEKPGPPALPGTISGETTVCPGTTGLVYQINPIANATSYEWQLPTGWSGTSTTNSITVTSGNTGNAIIKVRAKNECGNSEFQELNVNVGDAVPSQPGAISGPTSVCPGVSADYSISAVARATEYVWTLPNGDEQVTTIPNITVTTNTSGASSISVQAKNTCGISAKRNLIVSLKPGKPATPDTIIGSGAVCPGISQTYSVAAVTGATSYVWTLPNGWTGNSTSRSITVTTGTTGGTISVIASNDCADSEPETLEVTVTPGTPAVPEFNSPLTDVCPAETNIFTVNEVAGATGYIWTLPSGWSGTSTTNTISITSANSGTGSISVQATNGCGTSAKKTIPVSIKPPAPTNTASIQGPDNVCASTAGLTFTIPEVQYATDYVWSAPGWNITNGQGTRTITVTSGTGAGTISVKAKNTCGESVAVTKAVTVSSGVLAQPGTITSSLGNNQNICPPLSGITFTVPEVTGATGYKWSLPAGWEISSGANTRTITVSVTANAPYQDEIVSVTATNVCGDSQPRNFTNITVSNFIITDLGADQLVCRTKTQLTIPVEIYFGGSRRLKPAFTTDGDGTFQALPDIGSGNNENNMPRNFTIKYTPGTNDITKEFITIKVSVPKPHQQNPCGTGIDEMRVYFRNNPTASIATPAAICTGTSTTLAITGTPNSKVTYNKGTQTGLTVDIGSSGTATIPSGTLSANTVFTLTGITNIDAPTCSNSNLSSTATVTVTQTPTATISYDGPYCSSMATSTGAADLQGENAFLGGVFSATGDLGSEINAEDGSFIPEDINSGTYTVTYTIPSSGGCAAVSTTTEVTITPLPTAAIAYPSGPFCSSDSTDKLVTLTGTNAYTGGAYSSTTGLTIDANSGVIKPSSSTPGTYTVTYSLPAAAGCGIVEATTQVTITEIPTPQISFTQSQICKEDTNTYSATVAGSGIVTGGTFSAPAGLSITSAGVITPSISTPGTYKVTYTLSPANGCGEITTETEVTITPVPLVEISYAGPFCESTTGTKQITFANGIGAYENGSFTASPSGLTIDSATGAITPSTSTAGDYTVTYTIPASEGCSSKTAETTVNITAVPGATLSYPAPSFCNADISTYDISYSNTKGSYENGTFTGTAGLILDSSSGTITPQGSTPGTHTITYTIPTADGCESVTTSVNIEIIKPVEITSQPFNVGKCAGETAKLEVVAEGTNLTYQWYHNGSIVSGATSKILEFSPVDPDDIGNYYVEVSGSSPCSLVTSETVSLNVDENIEVSSTPENKELCVGDSTTFTVEATANGGAVEYQWMRNGEELTGEKSNSLVLNNISLEDEGEYSVSLKGPDGYNCSTLTYIAGNLNVYKKPVPVAGNDITICYTDGAIAITDGASVEYASSISWTTNGTGYFDKPDSLTEATYTPGPNESGTIKLFLTANGNSTCIPVEVEKTLTIERLPDISSFTYSATEFCETDSELKAPTIEGSNAFQNGTFTVTPATGLSITADGKIDPSASEPDTYQILYSTPAGTYCGSVESDPVTVVIGLEPIADFSYDSTIYCRDTRDASQNTNPVLALTEARGENFDSFTVVDGNGTAISNSGLDLNADTGAINLTNSTSGVYNVQRTLNYTGTEEDGCIAVTDEVTITITDKPIADFSYPAAEYCSDPSTTVSIEPAMAAGASKGTFSYTATPSGAILDLDIVTGEIDITASEEGTYIVTNIFDTEGDACDAVSDEFTITVDKLPSAVFSYAGLNAENSFCISSLGAILETSPDTGGTFSIAGPNTAVKIETLTGKITWTLVEGVAGDYVVTYTIPAGTVCDEVTHTESFSIDALPVGGELAFEGSGRLFMTCEGAVPGYAAKLNLDGHYGRVEYWEYRTDNTSWTTFNSQEKYLTGDEVEDIMDLTSTVGSNSPNKTTVFRAKIINGACSNFVYSKTAIVSVIPSNIEPTPVKVDPVIVCFGNTVSLSSETGYGESIDIFDGTGDFTSAGLRSRGWKFTDPNGGPNDFNAGANNGRADHWLKMNGSGGEIGKVYTGNLPLAEGGSTIAWSSILGVNEKFALVTGNNDSYMETPVFSLGSLDEAILTFDHGYNLTTGATISVELSTNGGTTYERVLFTITSDGSTNIGSSGNYTDFGKNKMVLDLGDYLGYSNLRVRFNYQGSRDGDVWAVDNIKVPEGPQGVLLQWFYDEDIENPNNVLEQIGQDNQKNVSFPPNGESWTKIGWNDFSVKTAILLDSNGNACESLNNQKDVRVFVFDQYETNVAVSTGSCGYLTATLDATITGAFQGELDPTEITIDGYKGEWKIEGPDGVNYTLKNPDGSTSPDPKYNPNVIFESDKLAEFEITWELYETFTFPNDYFVEELRGQKIENTTCPPTTIVADLKFENCSTLDFDGTDDVVVIDNTFSGVKAIEAWIRPKVSGGTIISGPSFEIQTPTTGISADSRWYHLAVIYDGSDNGLYIDGIRKGDPPTGTGGGSRTSIGAKWTSADVDATEHFSGWIEEVRIWKNSPTLKEIRFMMNQRLKLTGTGPDAKVVTPLEGEIVPNKPIAGSYYTANNYNLDEDGDAFYNQTAADLFAYYRLISDVPDPTLGIIANTYKPVDGNTPDLSLSGIPGRLYNMTTHQENTSPTPYFSRDLGTAFPGNWKSRETWGRPSVWDFPNSTHNGSPDGTPIDWNITKVSHNINSNNENIKVLGLVSENGLLNFQGINPSVWTTGTGGTGNELYISHYLFLDGVIDLNGESQLVQPQGSILDGGSNGELHRDQQGTANSYNYNYWSSPVIPEATSNSYTVAGVLRDGTTISNPPGTITFGDPYAFADGGTSSPIKISNYWISIFKGFNNDYFEWNFQYGSAGSIKIGEGFTMKGTSGNTDISDTQNYTFVGIPNNGNIDLEIDKVDLTQEYRDYSSYLIGNPYPSAIDAKQFIKDNLVSGNNNENSFNGTLYFWSHFAGGNTHILKEYIGGYAVYNLSGSIIAFAHDERINATGAEGGLEPEQYIPVGQSFFVNTVSMSAYSSAETPQGNESNINEVHGGTIHFKNSQRIFKKEGDHSVFHKPENVDKGRKKEKDHDDTRTKLWLKFKSPKGYHREILVAADENTTDGFDLGYDAPMIEYNIEDMFWLIGSTELVIQGLPDFNRERVIPLGVVIDGTESFTIEIAKSVNVPKGMEIYLKDKLNDSIHDLRKESYVSTSEPGYINERFEIVFAKDKIDVPVELPAEEPDEMMKEFGISIRHGQRDRELQILNPHELSLTNMFIFDLNGNKLEDHKELPAGKEFRMPVRGYSSGVYVVQVVVEGRVVSKKIIINN